MIRGSPVVLASPAVYDDDVDVRRGSQVSHGNGAGQRHQFKGLLDVLAGDGLVGAVEVEVVALDVVGELGPADLRERLPGLGDDPLLHVDGSGLGHG